MTLHLFHYATSCNGYKEVDYKMFVFTGRQIKQKKKFAKQQREKTISATWNKIYFSQNSDFSYFVSQTFENFFL